MASGSGDDEDEDTSTSSDDSERERERMIDQWRLQGTTPPPPPPPPPRLLTPESVTPPLSTSVFAGEQGRGEHVLIERRTPLQQHNGSPWSHLYSIDNPFSNHKRRSSPVPHNRPSTPLSSKSRRRTTPVPVEQDLPPPPLTLDSIQLQLNPLPLVSRQLGIPFRSQLLPEVTLLTLPLLFALYRLSSSKIPSLPIYPLTAFVLLIPFIALFRKKDSYLKVPFTDERGYRSPLAADDGVAAALALPLLLSIACLWETYSSLSHSPLDPGLGEAPITIIWEAGGIRARPGPAITPTPLETAKTLLEARVQLVLLNALNALLLVVHLALAKTVLRIDKLPKSNTKRFFGFMGLAWIISLIVFGSLTTWDRLAGPLPLSPLEAAWSTLMQQSSFYLVSRLARRGFTLGELNTMISAGNALTLEFWRLSRSRWLYKRGLPGLPGTFRASTAIVVFQSVLIPGAFLSGFLLSPLLVISRHIAQKPSHRLKWPTERGRHRRLLAGGVFLGLFGIIFFMLGGWASWQLGGPGLSKPWQWAISYVWRGTDGVLRANGGGKGEGVRGWKRWKRLVLVGYWAGTITVAVGGWQTHLVRARRIRMTRSNGPGSSSTLVEGKEGSPSPSITNGNGNSQSTREGSAASPGLARQGVMRVEQAREEKRVHASLNMRRKFFHALAVVMFVPGIAIDPAFTSLGFSVAFALFTFSEYARYFALYPIGGPLHIFFIEFVDSKDSGPVILSHFYLLTGCAGGLWLEGRGVNRFTGVLVLGIGDALASIVGKGLGRNRWKGRQKTVEGSIAFVGSIAFSAWFLRSIGWTTNFSLWRYTIATTLAALLEAASEQNDNLVIPIYMWSVVALLDCN